MRNSFRSLSLASARDLAPRRRPLRIEPLETRQLLDASPWQNPDNPLDVDLDQFIVALDALLIINRINSGVDPKLPDLAFGQSPDFYYDVDGDGFATATDVILIANRLNAGNSPPELAAALANDTGPGGVPNDDGITADATIAGTVTDVGPMVFFTASVNNSPTAHSIKNLIQPDGSFTITPAALEQLYGLPLLDGDYDVHLTAINELGYLTQQTVSLTLDRFIATPNAPQLDAAFDTGFSSTDGITRINTPRIHVTAEPGSTVTLYVNDEPLLEQVASPVATFDLDELPDGVHQFHARAVDGAGNVSALSAPRDITIRTETPVVRLITVPFQDDLTPAIRVVLDTEMPLTNGTAIYLDIDRDFDGAYDGPNEFLAGQATIYDNSALIHVNTPLDPSDPDVFGYLINLRVRYVDEAGNEGVEERPQMVSTQQSSALADYVAKDDGVYAFEDPQEIFPRQGGFRAYTVRMTSQQWRTIEDVNLPIWNHWVTIIVPSGVTLSNQTALLHITGGNNQSGRPTTVPEELSQMAQLTRSIVVNLPQVPSQSLIFTADETPGRQRTEDEIIAYSYDQFLKDPTDTEWPVLLAMTKAAVKAMDTVQTLVAEQHFPTVPANYAVQDFVVTGGSKRGWTTWLTAAVDDRVRAIIPTVFDALNLDEQMLHHYGAYGFFAQHIQDYEEMQIFERILTYNGALLGQIVDPYHYLNNGRFEIPKLILVSTGDQFFVSDSSQYYFHDLPGTKNYLRYVPNTGHGLNQDAVIAGAVFFNAVLTGQQLPVYSWTVEDDRSITMTSVTTPTEVRLWQATNPVARDFRQGFTDVVWTSTLLTNQGGGVYVGNVPKPESGATAFFIEATYPSGSAAPFKFTTDISVQTDLPLHPWAFDIADPRDVQLDMDPLPEGALSISAASAATVAPAPLGSLAFSALVGSDLPRIDAPLSAAAAGMAGDAIGLAADLGARAANSDNSQSAVEEALAAWGSQADAGGRTSGDSGRLTDELVDAALDGELFDLAGELESILDSLGTALA